MSVGDDATDPTLCGNLPVVQTVGYGKPPAQHRFKKGQSGNPGGRPRGRKTKQAPEFNPAHQPTSRMILAEAYRPVMIREGDKVLELPAIQAVMRAMGVSAMKGNRLAQKTLAEIVQRVEAEESALQLSAMENAIDYKIKWEREIARCQIAGLPDPAPIPHPDDIIIDMRLGGVRTEGPLTKEEKANWDKRIQRRTESQSEVTYYATQYRKARDQRRKDGWQFDWHLEQRIFDLINDSLPPRYKAKLTDRSYHAEASREGHTLSAYLEDRKRLVKARRWSR